MQTYIHTYIYLYIIHYVHIRMYSSIYKCICVCACAALMLWVFFSFILLFAPSGCRWRFFLLYVCVCVSYSISVGATNRKSFSSHCRVFWEHFISFFVLFFSLIVHMYVCLSLSMCWYIDVFLCICSLHTDIFIKTRMYIHMYMYFYGKYYNSLLYCRLKYVFKTIIEIPLY